LDCPIYIQARTILIGNIKRVTTCCTLDIEFLTWGNDNLTYEQNCIIFKYVFDYIKCSKRLKEAEFLSWVKIIFNFRGPQKKCLGTEWFSVSSIFFNSDLNFDKVSTFRILLFKLFHIFIELESYLTHLVDVVQPLKI
jgi:hypothetical protein